VPCREISDAFTMLATPERPSLTAGDYSLTLTVSGAGHVRLPTGRLRPRRTALVLGTGQTAGELVYRVVVRSP
jgi:hypothetical protein